MKIEKFGDNKVLVTKTKKIYDNKDKDKYIEVDDEPFEISQAGVDRAIEDIQAQIDFLNDPEKRASQIALLEEQLSDLNLIEQELNK